MAQQWQRKLVDSEATESLGAALAACVAGGGLLMFLRGELGAGKTTLVRGYLRGSGHAGAVKSPTYTLVEPYELVGRHLYHFDLYRLGDPEELEFLGMRDYLAADDQCLVEWPERGVGVLPEPDIELRLEYLPDGRTATLEAFTARGDGVLSCIRDKYGDG